MRGFSTLTSQDGVSCNWGNCFKASLWRIALCCVYWDPGDHRVERVWEEPTHRYCVGIKGPKGLKLLSESKVWARHPQEGRHIHRTSSLGAFPHTPRFGTSPSWVCSVFIFLAPYRRWLITSLSWFRGSEGAKPKQKISVPSWRSSSPARTSSRYHGNIHLRLPQNLNPPSPQPTLTPLPTGQGVPFILKERTSQMPEPEQSLCSKQTWKQFQEREMQLGKARC